jgi:hypothetical protein
MERARGLSASPETEMRVLELALAGVLAITTPIIAHANQPGSNMRPVDAGPAPSIVLASDGGGSRGHLGVVGAHPTAGQVRQWDGGWVQPHWRGNGHSFGWGSPGWQSVPTYWVWGPSGGAFDYPFADWRGPTGGWGNP